MLIEELDLTEHYRAGATRYLLDILEVEKILAQFLLADFVLWLPVILCQLSYSAQIPIMGLLRKSPQLHILDHALP
jgi:hypothetical protein